MAPNQAVNPSDHDLKSQIDIRGAQNVPAINICYQEPVSANQGGVIFQKFHQPCQDILKVFVCRDLDRNSGQFFIILGDGAQLPDLDQELSDAWSFVFVVVMRCDAGFAPR